MRGLRGFTRKGDHVGSPFGGRKNGYCGYVSRLGEGRRKDQDLACVIYCTAMVTLFEGAPPMVRPTGTAAPAGALSGTCTFTW